MPRQFLPFTKARAYVRRLKLKNLKEWKAYCRSGDKPKNIPNTPQNVYKDEGWCGYRDWIADTRYLVKGRYKTFRAARKHARTLGLSSSAE